MSADATQPGQTDLAEHATEDAQPTDSVTSQVMRYGNGSYELVLSAVALGLIGFVIDRRLGTVPIFMLVFTLLGFAGAAISIYYRYRNQINVLQDEAATLRAEALLRTERRR